MMKERTLDVYVNCAACCNSWPFASRVAARRWLRDHQSVCPGPVYMEDNR